MRKNSSARSLTRWRRAGQASLLAIVLAVAGCSGGGGDATKAVESARESVRQQDWKTAIIQLKSALQTSPDDREARLLLGRALLETGDMPAAGIELRKALQLGADPSAVQPLLAKTVLAEGDPKQVVLQFAAITLDDAEASAELKTTVATAFAAQGERDKALETVLAALKEWPGHIGATLLHARLKAADTDFAGALALADEVLAKEAAHLPTLLFKAEIQRLGLRDRAAALALYDQALAAHPRSVAAHSATVTMLLEQRELDAARQRFAAMQTAQPEHPETKVFEAQFAYIDRDSAKVRELTELLLRVMPNDLRVLQLAGANEMRLNNLPQAEAHLARVVKAIPGDPQPRNLLARIYNRTGQPGKALEVLRPIIASAEADSASLTLAGEAMLQNGDLARAEELFARAARGNPQATTARAALALGQVARGNTGAGFTELEAAAAADTGIRSNLALVAARLRSNDIPGALKAVDALERKQPDNPIAHTLRASVLLQKKDSAGATASFEKALAIDPLFYPATAGLAAIELAAGRPEGAQRRFDALLAKDPRNVRALLGVAELRARTGANKDEVTAAITAAVKANPGEAQPRVLLVNHLLQTGDAKAALNAAQEAGSALPGSVEVMDALGTAQLAAGQPQQAVTTFTQLVAARSDRPEPQLRLADAHAANKDLPAARRALEKALEIRRDYFPAERGLALLALQRDDAPEALRVAQRVQRAQPKAAAGHLLEADIHQSRNQPDAAVAPLRKALELEPAPQTAIRLHAALSAANRGAEAERHAAAWRREQPRDVAFRYYLGDQAMARKEYAVAEGHYRGVLEVQPDNALALNNVAWLMATLKRPGALPLAEKANQLLPDQPALMDTLAWVLALDNQVPRAVELQKRAMAKAPQDQGLRLTLAKIYLQGGDKAQARTELEALAAQGEKFGAQAEVKQLLSTL